MQRGDCSVYCYSRGAMYRCTCCLLCDPRSKSRPREGRGPRAVWRWAWRKQVEESVWAEVLHMTSRSADLADAQISQVFSKVTTKQRAVLSGAPSVPRCPGRRHRRTPTATAAALWCVIQSPIPALRRSRVLVVRHVLLELHIASGERKRRVRVCVG